MAIREEIIYSSGVSMQSLFSECYGLKKMLLDGQY